MKPTESRWDAKLYADKHAFVFDYGEALIEMLSPKPSERILDLGCGTGQLTASIKQKAHDVIGMDASQDMVDAAKNAYPMIEFKLGDAANFTVDQTFDAIFSNATLHWVLDYEAAIACMYAALKTGGRLVLEMGGQGNVKSIVDALRSELKRNGYEKQAQVEQWYFPPISEYTTALEKHGFEVRYAELYDRPTELVQAETGITDWLRMFGQKFLEDIPEKHVEIILDNIQAKLKTSLFKKGKWYADYRRLRIIAYKI